MNNSKKTIRGPEKSKKTRITTNPKIWIITSIVLAVLLIGAILFDQLYERVIITVDEEDYHLSDLTYYFYNVESQYDYINQLYGGQYWDMTANEEGTITVRDIAKEEAVSSALYNEIMYREAMDAEYTLTKEETDKVTTDVASILYEQNLSEELIKANGFTGEYLTDVLTKIALAARYRQDVVDSLDIDDAAIETGFKYEDYRQYDIEYLFISTQTTDDEGNTVAVSDDLKKSAFDKISAKYEEALKTEDWSALVPEDETELKYQTGNFLASGTDFSDEFEALMMAMENNEVSEVYEDEKGYYIVRMINNKSFKSYDKAVGDAITKAEDEAFQTKYTEDILPKHTYDVNEKALRPLRMGTITLAD